MRITRLEGTGKYYSLSEGESPIDLGKTGWEIIKHKFFMKSSEHWNLLMNMGGKYP